MTPRPRPSKTRRLWGGVVAWCCALVLGAWALPAAAQDAVEAAAEAAGRARAVVAALVAMRHDRVVSAEAVEERAASAEAVLEAADAALGEAAAREPADRGPAREALAAELRQRAARAQLVMLRGELWRAAAEATHGRSPRSVVFAERAIDRYRDLRLAYRDLLMGQLGYVGEARVRRLAGEFDAAREVIEPLIRGAARPRSPAELDLRLLLMFEQAETAVARDPAAGLHEVARLESLAEFRQDEAWRGRLAWLRARGASAAALDAASGGATASEAAAALRDPEAVAVAGAYARLSRLAALAEADPAVSLTPAEAAAWAEALSAHGYAEQALGSFAQAERRGPLPVEALLTYAAELWRAGRYADAADRYDRALGQLDSDDPRRTQALQWRGSALLAAWREADGDPALAERAAAALLAVVDSEAPDAARVEALRAWASLAPTPDARALERVRDRLAEHRRLVEADPHLRYAAIDTAWRLLRTRGGAASGGGVAPEGEARALAARAAELAAEQQRDADGGALAASAALLHAAILGEPPIGAPDEALAALERTEAMWSARPAVAQAAAVHRARWRLALGQPSGAADALLALPGDAEVPRDLAVRVAAALAAGVSAGEGNPEGDAGRVAARVGALVDQALGAVPAGAVLEPALALEAAEALAAVGAAGRAEALVARALDAGGGGSDAPARVRIALAERRAAAMRGQGLPDEATDLLVDLAGELADEPAAHRAVGDHLAALGRSDDAAVAYRAARERAARGSAAWWRATLGLTAALTDSGQPAAAREVLRVAAALYPYTGDDPTLADRIERARAARGPDSPGSRTP